MERTNEHASLTKRGATTTTDGELLDPEARRRALEHRIEITKNRLVADIARVRGLMSEAATRAKQGLTRAAVRTAIGVGVLMALGLVAVLVRRRQRRIRITWR